MTIQLDEEGRDAVTYEYSEAVAVAEAQRAQLERAERHAGVAKVRSYVEFPYVRAV